LTKEQVSGGEKGTASTTSVKPVETVKSGDGGGATSSGSSGGVGGGKGGGSPSPLPIVALLGVAAGGAYYMDLIPGMNKKENTEPVTVTEKAAPAPVKKAEAKKTEQPKKLTKAPPKNPETKEVQKSVVKETGTAKKKEASQPHRVLNIHVPPKNGRVQEPVPPTQHATDGNRVSNADFRKVYLQDTVVLNGKRKSTTTASPPTAAMANDALKELEPSVGTSVVDETMAKEQARMRASADETLNDLESLTASQLRVRVVQLVSEISDRTKWEAVRLKEFLTMKEREVGEQ
jgi:mitofilin